MAQATGTHSAEYYCIEELYNLHGTSTILHSCSSDLLLRNRNTVRTSVIRHVLLVADVHKVSDHRGFMCVLYSHPVMHLIAGMNGTFITKS